MNSSNSRRGFLKLAALSGLALAA
ncbi:MAG TPA: twin-arginine translocation signal domain-containing protein, partial [Nannocystis exedens]|nr:twin-arginine translocation signal domain-containing protein [Nannocystis exedens]